MEIGEIHQNLELFDCFAELSIILDTFILQRKMHQFTNCFQWLFVHLNKLSKLHGSNKIVEAEILDFGWWFCLGETQYSPWPGGISILQLNEGNYSTILLIICHWIISYLFPKDNRSFDQFRFVNCSSTICPQLLFSYVNTNFAHHIFRLW